MNASRLITLKDTNYVSYVISLEINGILFSLAYFAIKINYRTMRVHWCPDFNVLSM